MCVCVCVCVYVEGERTLWLKQGACPPPALKFKSINLGMMGGWEGRGGGGGGMGVYSGGGGGGGGGRGTPWVVEE